MLELVGQSLAPNTVHLYQRGIRYFFDFRHKYSLSNIWPVPVDDILSFMGHLVNEQLSHSSVACYLAGLSFYSKLHGFVDNTQAFIVRKMLDGIKRSQGIKKDTRLPITTDLLHVILGVLPSVCKSLYELLLFKAAFTLAFFGLLRISELALTNKNSSHTISITDISFNNGMLQVCVPSSKTDQFARGKIISIQPQSDKTLCPLSSVQTYLSSRPIVAGPLFCHLDGTPLTRYQLVSVLKKSLNVAGINQTRYSSHSFRIGAATSLSKAGFSDDTIMQAGRWKSLAYKRYIRL